MVDGRPERVDDELGVKVEGLWLIFDGCAGESLPVSTLPTPNL